ncbi:MAG: RDD family protein [Pirellulales bacterium]
MDEPQNPYSPPLAQDASLDRVVVGDSVQLASQGARFVNVVVDYTAQFVIGMMVGIVVTVIGGQAGADWLDRTPGLFIGIPIMLGYYFLFEVTTSRTLGKLLTGTRVVDEYGHVPTTGQIAGRTLCRLIPFEAFSFLGKPTRGWHDSIPNTYVVKVTR